jgi:hypothetical protein
MCPEVDSASESEYQGFLLGQRRLVRLAAHLPPLYCRKSRRSGALTYPEPLGPLRPVAGCLYVTFTLSKNTTNHDRFGRNVETAQ